MKTKVILNAKPWPAVSLALLLAAPLFTLRAEPTPVPRHLVEAEHLVDGLSLSETNYEHGEPSVSWSSPKASHTDCSGFFDALLMHTYHYTPDEFKLWFDSHRPSARRYHDAIIEQRGFTQIHHINHLRPGDILAVKYMNRTDNTGHVMLVDGFPKRRKATEPFVDGTEQWEVEIIDSSKTGHGTGDTRHKMGPEGKDHDGLGRGVLRLYTTADGKVAGFAWSTMKVSKFKTPDDEDLVMGRLIPDYKPQ
jgi:hypothetical protein